MLTEPGPLAQGPIGRTYQRQVRRVRELMARLQEVDPEWLAEWKQQERGENQWHSKLNQGSSRPC